LNTCPLEGVFAAAGTTPRSSLDEAVGNDVWYLTSWFTVITTASRSTALTSTTAPFLPTVTISSSPTRPQDVANFGREEKKEEEKKEGKKEKVQSRHTKKSSSPPTPSDLSQN